MPVAERPIDVIILEAAVHIMLDEALRDIAGQYAALTAFASRSGDAAEQHDIAAKPSNFPRTTRVAMGRRIAVDLGRKIELNDVTLLEFAIGRTGDGMRVNASEKTYMGRPSYSAPFS